LQDVLAQGKVLGVIKAIETIYKGYRFRSRTEARWAVYFDEYGTKWQYEVQGFQLPSGWYLPDFYVGVLAGEIFVEIKASQMPSDITHPVGMRTRTKEMQLARELAAASGTGVMICYGEPLAAWRGDDGHGMLYYDHLGNLHQFAAGNDPSAEKIIKCATLARQARFEHGQVGSPTQWRDTLTGNIK
jgi:hypothetical protein